MTDFNLFKKKKNQIIKTVAASHCSLLHCLLDLFFFPNV